MKNAFHLFATKAVVTILLLLPIVTLTQVHGSSKEHPMNLSTTAIPAEQTFQGCWPYHSHYFEGAGFRMHYIDESPVNGPARETLLLLHGEPTWSYLYRQQIAIWAQDYRVIAVDHMGFGKSETPADRSYWLQDHVDNLEKLVLHLDLTNITLVMHDFGGPTGMGLAIRHPERIKQFISINAPTPAGQPDLVERLTANLAKSPWFQWVVKAEKDGTLEQVLGQLDFTILSTLKINGFERNAIINDNWLAAYRAPFPSPQSAAGAIGWAKGFATGAHEFAVPDDITRAKISQKPALAIWGMADKTLHGEEFIPLFKQLFPRGQIKQLPGVGHYSPEDAPHEVARLVGEFIAPAGVKHVQTQ